MLGSLRSRGTLYSIGIVINRVVPVRIFRMRVFRVFELCGAQTGRNERGVSEPDTITFRWCDSIEDRKQAEALTHYRPDGNAHAHRACLALDGGMAVGGLWIGVGQFDETDLGVRIELADDQVWLFASFVMKSHRQQGIYRKLLDHTLLQYAEHRVFASINPTNKASIAAHSDYTKRVVGTSWVARIMSFATAKCNGSLVLDRRIGSVAVQPLQMKVDPQERIKSGLVASVATSAQIQARRASE